MTKKIIILLILLFISAFALFAQGENLNLKIAVIGPGSEVYFWWGHIALVIEDLEKETSTFYDYGLFSFENKNFYKNFALGRLLYSTGSSSTKINIAVAIKRNRSIAFYPLDLPPETRLKIKDFVENNVRPENRDYYYQHFKDNCSTRIRDIVDLATDGQFKELYGNIQSRFTLRDHVRRYTWFAPAWDWILNFWMGQVIDTPIAVWDDMFLPAEVGRRIQEFWYTDADGVRRKLVPQDSLIEQVYTAEGRPIVLEVPRKQWPYELVFSLALSAIFCFFFFLYHKKIKAGKVLAGFSMSLCALVFGLAGLVLYFLSLFTNHDYTYENANMIFTSPVLLAAIPLGICYALTKKPEKQLRYDLLLRIIWLITVIGIFISMLIKLLPWFYQQNLTDQMLMLPISLVFAFQPVGLSEAVKKIKPWKKTS